MDKQYYIYEGLFTRGNIKETIQELEGEDAWNEVKDLSIQEIEKSIQSQLRQLNKPLKQKQKVIKEE